MIGFVCSYAQYVYKDVLIELPPTGGPAVIKKDGRPYERIPKEKLKILQEFIHLTRENREKYLCKL